MDAVTVLTVASSGPGDLLRPVAVVLALTVAALVGGSLTLHRRTP